MYMFKGHPLKSYLKYSIAAALLYGIAAGIFIHTDAYQASYILYIGNMVFGICIGIFVYIFNKRRNENANSSNIVAAGHITTIMGVLIACAITFILLLVIAPGSFRSVSQTADAMGRAPSQLAGNNKGLGLVLFLDAVFGNVGAGSFVSFLLPFSLKRDQSDTTRVTNRKGI